MNTPDTKEQPSFSEWLRRYTNDDQRLFGFADMHEVWNACASEYEEARAAEEIQKSKRFIDWANTVPELKRSATNKLYALKGWNARASLYQKELERVAEWSCVACEDHVRHVCHRHAIQTILRGGTPILGEVAYPCACELNREVR